MSAKFSPSINIIRDAVRSYNYFITPNAQNIVGNIINDFNVGIHCSVIIGSYGTGKSSLLWAFEQTLKGKERFFDISPLEIDTKKVRFIRFVGEYQSIINSFSEQLNVQNKLAGNQEVFDAIYQVYEPVRKGGLLVILIDELGKYLEYAAKHGTEKELYFIQQLAEFVNDPERKILLLATLHQNFEAYSTGLEERQRHEWSKVKGRLKENTFNEPIEQLLSLAADYNQGVVADKKSQKKIEILNHLVYLYKIFGVKKQFVEAIGVKLYPLDFITGYCLTMALKNYGQNERSLFTFLESKEFKSFNRSEHSFFNLVWLHDYLWSNFYSLLNSKNNPNYNAWVEIKSAIERVEAIFTNEVDEAVQIIKVIGLLSIFSSKGASINHKFLNSYFENACGLDNCASIIDILSSNKIIIYSKFNDSFRLFQGTDVDIDKALLDAGKKVDEIEDIASYVNRHFGKLPYVTAKEITYKTGTPRVFEFVVSGNLQYKIAEGEIDGYINLIINKDLSQNDVIKHSKEDQQGNVYGFYKSAGKIRSFVLDIEKAYKVKSENPDDKVVQKEMDKIIANYSNLLKHYFLDAIYSDNVVWIYQGNVVKRIINKGQFNKWLSEICSTQYSAAPVFKNEHINRHSVSSSIHTARKNFFEHLVNNWSDSDLNYDGRFPPDKTIYISLLRENGLHRKVNGGYTLSEPFAESTFYELWQACEDFLKSTKHEQRPITELYAKLLKKPFKIKLGLAELWVPTYLFIKRDDFALFGDNGYITDLNEITLLLLARNAKEYSVKAFNLQGVRLDFFNKYREFLQLKPSEKPNNRSFIESINPFLVFLKQLPAYSKNTTKLKDEALAVREAIKTATDPEKTFFEDFPKALHTNIKELYESKEALQNYSEQLKSAINELRNSYDKLIERFEKFICGEIVGKNVPFEEYKNYLQKRHQNIQTYLMVDHQQAFHIRINSPLDDKKSWLSSIAQALLNKPLESINDDEEKLLHKKFKTIIHELDNLSDISAIKYDQKKEKVFKFEITTDKVNETRIVKIPISKFEELEDTEKRINKILKSDKQFNIAVLAKLIQEQIKR